MVRTAAAGSVSSINATSWWGGRRSGGAANVRGSFGWECID